MARRLPSVLLLPRLAGRLALVALLALPAGCGGFAAELGEAFAEGALDELNHRLYEDDEDDAWGDAWSSRAVAPAVTPRSAPARTVDCAGITDELDQGYRNERLRSPERFVPLREGALDRAAWEALPRGDLRLEGHGGGGAIALVRTSAGHDARMLVSFDADGGAIALRDLTVVDADGGVVARHPGPIALPLRLALDLDPEEDGFDLLVGRGDAGPELAATPAARLRVPTRSLCAP